MEKTALIIGGTGFIGQALCTQLLSQRVKVHVIARHADMLPKNKNLYAHKASMEDSKLITNCLSQCSHVYFTAADTIPGNSVKKPIVELEKNLKPALIFLDSLQNFPDVHLIFFSSGGTVYGDPKVSRVSEDHALNPLSYHGAMKTSLEAFMHAMTTQCGSHISVLRPSNVYGPKQRYRPDFGIIRKLLEHARQGKPIEIWGDGEAIRDYLFIDDCVSATLSLMNIETKGFNSFNIGSGTGYSINDICDIVDGITGNPLQRHYHPARSIDVKKTVLDSTKLRQITGWQPMISLKAGIENTWEWLQKNPGH